MEYTIYRPFGPQILKAKIPQKIIDGINKHIDDLILDKKRKEKQNYGHYLAGDVTQEFKLEQEFAKEIGWIDFLAKCSYEYINHATNQKIRKFNVISTWVVRQFKNEFNPAHWHGGHISGAGFLKLPKNFGKHKQLKQNREYRGGNLQLIHGSRMFLCQSTYTIVPEVGDFYFFPNYLMHTVFPFKDSDEERRSISFNAVIDDNIYDVYGT